jgi:predicted DNA-binding WGR domain protein
VEKLRTGDPQFLQLNTPDELFRRFEHKEKKKFWEVHVGMSSGGRWRRHTRAGKLGAPADEEMAYFDSEAQANRSVKLMVESKRAAGYRERKTRGS